MASQSQHQPVDLPVVRTRVPVGPGNRLMSHGPELAEAAPGVWPPGWDGGCQGTHPAESHRPTAGFPSRGFLQMRSHRGGGETQKTRSEERERQARGGERASGGGEGGRPHWAPGAAGSGWLAASRLFQACGLLGRGGMEGGSLMNRVRNVCGI